VQKCVRNKKA